MRAVEEIQELLEELEYNWEVNLKNGDLTRGKFVTLRTKIEILKWVLEIE